MTSDETKKDDSSIDRERTGADSDRPPAQPKVFISYGGPDEAFAHKLHGSLGARGVSPFLYMIDALAGQPNHQTMYQGVNAADWIVVVCSESSLHRPGVQFELEEVIRRRARDGKHRLVPIALDAYIYSFEGKNVQWADELLTVKITELFGWNDESAFDKAVENLIARMSRPGALESLGSIPATARVRRTTRHSQSILSAHGRLAGASATAIVAGAIIWGLVGAMQGGRRTAATGGPDSTASSTHPRPDDVLCRPPFDAAAVDGFVGRQDELRWLREGLSQGKTLGVSGVGGAGKTALVRQALHLLSQEGKLNRGVIWVAAGDRSTADILKQLADGTCQPDLAARLEREPKENLDVFMPRLRRLIEEQRSFVVLDDVTDDEQETMLLTAFCGLPLVETRRGTFRHECFQDRARWVKLEGLTAPQCQGLFVQQAGLGNEPPVIDVARDVCERLWNHPLAVKIAAARLREQPTPLSVFLEQMKEYGVAGLSSGAAIQESLMKSFARSLEGLNETARLLFVSLGAFPEGAMYDTGAIAAIVARANDAKLDQDLRVLTRRLLIEWNPREQRYGQHPLVRQFAAELLAAKGPASPEKDRLIEHYGQALEKLHATPLAELQRLPTGDMQLLEYASRSVVEQFRSRPTAEHAKTAVRWANASWTDVWDRKASEGKALLQTGYDAAKYLHDREQQAELARALAELAEVHHDRRESLRWAAEGLRLARATGKRKLLWLALLHVGGAHQNLGEERLAIAHLREALTLSRRGGDPSELASSLNALANAYAAFSDYPEAKDCYDEALKILDRTADPSRQIPPLTNLALLYDEIGSYDLSLRTMERARTIAQETNDVFGFANTSRTEAEVVRKHGDYAKAIELYNDALRVTRKIGDRQGERVQLMELGRVHRELLEYEESLQFFALAKAIAVEVDHRWGQGVVLAEMAFCLMKLGRLEEARRYLEEALPLSTEEPHDHAQALHQLGDVLYLMGGCEDALVPWTKAIELYRGVNERDFAAVVAEQISACGR